VVNCFNFKSVISAFFHHYDFTYHLQHGNCAIVVLKIDYGKSCEQMGMLIHAVLLSLAPTLPGILNCRLSTRTYCVDSLFEKREFCKNACQSNTVV